MEATKKQHVIKYLNRYKKQITEAETNELPKLVANLYNYLIKKSILIDSNSGFIKESLVSQINQSINCYMTNSKNYFGEKKKFNRPLKKIQCEILDYYKKGCTLTEISEKVNRSAQTINKHVKYICLSCGVPYEEITENRFRKLVFSGTI